MAKKKTISAPFYNIGQLRVNYWNTLQTLTAELERCYNGSSNEKRLIGETKDVLKQLGGVEKFFAFPGLRRLELLNATLSRHEHTALSNLVAETTQQLVSDGYRGNPYFLLGEDESGTIPPEDIELQNPVRKNYFEVLFVEDMSEADERGLKQKISELRDPNDPFTYGIVVQRSFQDALIALLFNHNIQAVVVRYAPPYHSKGISQLIKPYIQNALRINLSNRTEVRL
ncbi:MAG: ornithine decarboxylase, partial [Leptolyngbya sp. SIO3F4]|nr:ornithine decarboxylase [Leptolyngbya sp. SIO3F4]